MKVSTKKMMLAYKDATKDFHSYKIYYLEKPIIVKFNYRVHVFQCHSPIQRLGVTKLEDADKVVLHNHLRNVAGSLPVTVKEVRKVFNDETLFINLNPDLVGIFDWKGQLMDYSGLPKVFDAMLAVTVSGMKVKDDEASYLIRAHQIMLKKDMPWMVANQGTCRTLMFNLSDGDEDNDN